MFYINYEECKLGAKKYMLRTNDGFILTMRNVNFQVESALLPYGMRFILTMRNVNNRVVKNELMAIKVLY